MKRILKKLWGFIFILVLLCSNLSVYADDGTVSEVSLYHAHSGSASGGGCYTKPNYHSHTGNTTSGGSCYTPVYHSHKGNTSSGGACYKTPVYHSHTGNSTSGGGCYTVAKTRIEARTCTPVLLTTYHSGTTTRICSTCGTERTHNTYVTTYQHSLACDNPKKNESGVDYGSNGKDVCTVCGTTNNSWGDYYYNNPHNYDVSVTYYDLGCGKTASTIERYNQSCGKTTATIENYALSCTKTAATIDSYSLGCDKTPSTQVGKIQLNKVSGVDYCLSVSTTNAVINSCTWNNGQKEHSICVTGNQEYSCQVNYSIEGRSETAVLCYNVTDYDTSGPEVTVNYDDSTWEQSKTISVIAVDNGAGLHNAAYRYHNGIAWSEWSGNASYHVDANGTYQVEVRDALGNVTKKEIVIKTIIINIPSDSTNVFKPVEMEDNKEASNEKVPTVDTIPSKENLQKEAEMVTEEKEEILVESGTIDVKNAMSEPEKEEVIYQTITVTDDVKEEVSTTVKENQNAMTNYVQIPYEENVANKTNGKDYSQMVCAMGVIGVPFLFFGCMGNTRIYGVNEQGKRKFLCKAFLTKKGKLKISRFYLKKNKSNTILIKPSKGILDKKYGKLMYILIGERDFAKNIQEEILLEY